MSAQIAKIVQVMMANLDVVRYVENIEFVGNDGVRFTIHDKKFDVRGRHPMLSVHQVVGSCLTASVAAADIEQQLNS